MPTAPLELRALDVLLDADATPADLAARLGVPATGLGPLLAWAEQAGFARRTDVAAGPLYGLTPSGAQLAATRREMAAARGPDGRLDVDKMTELVVRQQYELVGGQFDEATSQQAGIPATDAWRDWGTTALSDAYAAGRITEDQLDARAAAVLTAQTMGDLRTALTGVARLPLVPGVPLPAHAETPLPVPQPTSGVPVGRLLWIIAVGGSPGVLLLLVGDTLFATVGVLWILIVAIMATLVVGTSEREG